MKLAVFGESSADEAAVRILVEGVVGKTEIVQNQLRAPGWPAVLNILPAVIKYLQYKTEADGLVVIADSNHSLNRFGDLKVVAKRTTDSLSDVHGRLRLKVAIGVASPAIEAWLLSHRRGDINEAKWKQGLVAKRDPYSKLDLKRYLYGVERPSLQVETEKMIEAANELSRQISSLEKNFPDGFGGLVNELRTWSI